MAVGHRRFFFLTSEKIFEHKEWGELFMPILCPLEVLAHAIHQLLKVFTVFFKKKKNRQTKPHINFHPKAILPPCLTHFWNYQQIEKRNFYCSISIGKEIKNVNWYYVNEKRELENEILLRKSEISCNVLL